MIDLRKTLSAIESRLQNELYSLKMMIQSIMPQNFHHQAPQYYQQQNYYNPHQGFAVPSFQQQFHHQAPAPPIAYHYQNNNQHINDVGQTARSAIKNMTTTTTPKPTTSSTENIFRASFAKQPEIINVMKNKLRSLDSGKSRSTKLISVTQAPSTTTSTTGLPEPKNEYTYYWKLESFPKVFMTAKKNEVFSHVFNVKGLYLRIRALLHHHEEQNLILDIEHLANIENGDKFEIEISDGFVFKEIAEEKLFQYSFAVMDQTKPDHDLISPIYWNTDNDNFLVPNSVYVLANYVKNDSLLIKLIIMF